MEENQVMTKVTDGIYATVSVGRIISSIIILLVSIFMLFVAILPSIIHMHYIETLAIIVDIQYNSDENNYIPIYEFNVDGEIVRANGPSASNKDMYQIGTEETINYNPANYKKFDVGSRENSNMLIVLGSFFLIISSISLYQIIKSMIIYFNNKNVVKK